MKVFLETEISTLQTIGTLDAEIIWVWGFVCFYVNGSLQSSLWEEKPGCHWKKLLVHISPLLLCTISHCEIYPDQFMSLHCLCCLAVEAGVLQTELWLYLLFIISQPSAKRQNKWAHTLHEKLSTKVRNIILYKKYLTKINISMSLPDYLCELLCLNWKNKPNKATKKCNTG